MGGEDLDPCSCTPRPYLVIGGDFLKVRIQTETQPFQVAQGGSEPLGIAANRPLVPLIAGVSAGVGEGGRRDGGSSGRSQSHVGQAVTCSRDVY